MKRLFALILMVGCVGGPTPNNPLTRKGDKLWWQKDSTNKAVAQEWNKFNIPAKKKDWSDPWADFEEPRLFPDTWKPAEVKKSSAEQTEDLFRWFEKQKKKDRTI